MKHRSRTILLLLISAFMLVAVSCGKKPQPSGNNGIPFPDQTDPTALAAEKPIVFDPETDYDNRYGSLISSDMLETEDAFYLRSRNGNGFLYYYDKTTGDTGVLCPRPECVHDEKRNNAECAGYIGSDPGLQYYQGKLWYVMQTKGMRFGLYRMNLDGSSKELVHEFDPTDTPLEYHNRRLYIHRGMIYHAGYRQEIKNAAVFHKLVYGCIPMEDTVICGQKVKAWEYYEILERETINQPQPTMFFAGDSAYMFYDYDGVVEYDGADSEDEFYDWRSELPITDEIARWDPSMTEPEILYQSVGYYPMLCNYRWSIVTSDGTPYFVDPYRADPEQPESEDNPYVIRLYRLEKDGTRTCVLDTGDREGGTFLLSLGNGVIATADTSIFAMNDRDQPVNVSIIRFGADGTEVLYEGPLPLEYRNELRIGVKNISLADCWVSEDTLILYSSEYFGKKDYDRSWHFVKYDIAPEGLLETVLLEDYEVQFWGSN